MDLLAIFDHPVDDLPPEVPDWVVWKWMLHIHSTPSATMPDLQAFYDCRKKAVVIALHLKEKKKRKAYIVPCEDGR